jgi:hypothetical protein
MDGYGTVGDSSMRLATPALILFIRIAIMTIQQYFAFGDAGMVFSIVGAVIALRGIIGFWKALGQQHN